MKDTGVARKVDDLGRIVLPSELRRLHGIEAGDELAISIDGEAIVLRKVMASCLFCGSSDRLETYRSKPVCRECRAGMAITTVMPAEPVTEASTPPPA